MSSAMLKTTTGWTPVVDANINGSPVPAGVAPITTATPVPWQPVYPFFCGNPYPWRTRVDHLTTLDPNSAAICAYFKSQNPFPGFAAAAECPVYMVGPDQPMVPVTIQESYQPWAPFVTEAPIPDGALMSTDDDHLMVVVQETPSAQNHRMWEFWVTSYSDTPTVRWSGGPAVTGWAAWIGIQRMHILTDNPGYSRNVQDPSGAIIEQPSWGPCACHASYMGGQIQQAEVQEGYIGHALQLVVPWARKGTWSFPPAQYSDGTLTDTYSVPEGAWFRLDPTVDLTTLPFSSPFGLLVATAMQQFGGIVTDQTASAVGFSVDTRAPTTGPMLAGGMTDNIPWLYEEYFPWQYLQLLPLNLKYHARQYVVHRAGRPRHLGSRHTNA